MIEETRPKESATPSGNRHDTSTQMDPAALRLAQRQSDTRGLSAKIWSPLALMLIVLLACVASLAPLLPTGKAAAAGRPPGGAITNPVVRAVDIASPAVVRLATLYNAHITLNVCGRVTTLPSAGAGYVLGGLGSGAFVSSNGDILTADHVVHISTADLDSEIFQASTPAADIAALLNASTDCIHLTGKLTAADIAGGFVQFLGIPYNTAYSAPKRLAWMNTTYSGPLNDSTSNDLLESLNGTPSKEVTVLQSSAFDQNDLALVHADLTDTPSIQLDDSTTVAVQDSLTIIGFPGNGDVTTTATNLLTPSVNSITVSAIKSNDNGARLLQVGGNVEHGDSGGPALDASGNIVGIVSFGGDDPRGSTAFLRSSNSANSLIADAKIDTRPGAFQQLWQRAFNDYASSAPGHWHRAASELDALAARYPAFQGIVEYRHFATTASLTERVPTSDQSLSNTTLIAGGVGVAALLLLVLMLMLVARSRRKARRARAAASQALANGPYTGYPVGPGYPYNNLGAPQSQYPTYGQPPSQFAGAPQGIAPYGYGVPNAPTTATASGPHEPQSMAGGGVAVGVAAQTQTAGAGDLVGVCVNGHQMSATERFCAVCGAPRMPQAPSFPSESEGSTSR